MRNKIGKIVTFYSYKGGTGRTMALSNVAWILASNGYEVLLIDWDLEAPGLHRFLRPFLIDPELTSTPGLIDFVWEAASAMVTPENDGSSQSALKLPSLDDYAVGLDWNFQNGGAIAYIPAGQQDENYAQRVNTFNWDNFYERLGGGKLLQAERDDLRAKYDYILIDSRTGVSDTSSICTVQMPDALVVCFTLNRQSISGAAAVAASVAASIKTYRNEQVPIYPVPTRIENAQRDKLEQATAYARRLFAPFLLHVQADGEVLKLEQQVEYWQTVETPYVAFYAFEEVPAAFKDEPGSRTGVLAAHEGIAARITGGAVTRMERQSDADREKVVNAYAFPADETSAPQPPSNLAARKDAAEAVRKHATDASPGATADELWNSRHGATRHHMEEIGRPPPIANRSTGGNMYSPAQPVSPLPVGSSALGKWLGITVLCIMALAVGLYLVYSWYLQERNANISLREQLSRLQQVRGATLPAERLRPPPSSQPPGPSIATAPDRVDMRTSAESAGAVARDVGAEARVHAQRGDYASALRDFDEALRNSEQAIGQAQQEVAEALNGRCWVNAVRGELAEALADCNKALTLRPAFTEALDSLAFTYLKMGRGRERRAIELYDIVLRGNPEQASSLFGRGTAKLKIGDGTGAADIAAAKSINPGIAEEFARYGLR